MTDWSGIPLNVHGAPLGYVCLTPEAAPGLPLYVKADSIASVQSADGPNAAITYGLSRVVVKENLRVVFRMKAEANTMKPVEVVKVAAGDNGVAPGNILPMPPDVTPAPRRKGRP
jgi:hypothetical protein